MAKTRDRPCIYVLAGTNGGGKSSVAGAAIRARGAEYFNPDDAARLVLALNPGFSLEEANGAAWQEGKRLLERAIVERRDYAFETTLGGITMPALLRHASESGLAVRVWFVGLSSPELHLARVRQRVSRGGHDIPEKKIRERYDSSRTNLIELLPFLTELRLFDNSVDGDPHVSVAPQPLLVLHVVERRVQTMCEPGRVPAWAKPIVAAALRPPHEQS